MSFLVYRNANIYKGLLFIIAGLLPLTDFFRIQFTSIAIIILSIWWLANLRAENIKQLYSNQLIWLFVGLYLINVFNLIQVDNLHEASKLLLKKLALLLFPLIIGTSVTLNHKDINRIIGCFGISLFILCLYSFRNGLAPLLDRDNIDNIARAFLIDRPYFGLFAAFIAICTFIYIFEIRSTLKPVVIGLFLFFVLEIYLAYAKMAFVALILAFIGIGFLYISYKVNLIYNLLIYSICIGIIIYIGSTNKTVKNVLTKIQNAEEFSFTEYDINVVASINIRYINWGCSLKAIQDADAWLIGLGPGDTKEKLFPCYAERNPWIYQSKMNAHSEYIEETLRNGLTGLIWLVASLFIPLWLSVRTKNYLYFGFLVIVIVCSLTESILSRQIGIIFYAFFNSLLAFSKPVNPVKNTF